MMKHDKDKNKNQPHGEYDAFISYKHSEFDSEICLTLHKQLESYKVKKGKEQRKVKRVFLDTEELASAGSLSKSIQDALDNSRHLIVICSKETPQSPWVKKEIEYFVAKHGYDKVLALLIDGEPSEAFPEPLRYANINGILKEVEPLAADIRAENPKQSKKALKREILRLLAPLLGMTYDELRQRHQKMVVRRIIRTASLVAALLLCFGLYVSIQWQNTARLNNELQEAYEQLEDSNDKIIEQNTQLRDNNILITQQNNDILAAQSRYMAREALGLLDSGNRRLSLLLARAALPASLENPDRPFVDEAEFALTETLGAYTYPNGYFHYDAVFTYDSKVLAFTYDPQVEYITAATSTHLITRRIGNGEVIWSIPVFPADSTNITIKYSPDGSVIYTNAPDGYLAAINADTGDIIWTSQIRYFAFSYDMLVCIGDNPDGNIFNPEYGQIDLSNGQIIKTFPESFGYFTYSLTVSPDGRYFAAESINSAIIIETRTGRTIYEEEFEHFADVFLSYNTAVIVHRDYTYFLDTQNELIFFDLEAETVIDRFDVNGSYQKIYFMNDNLAVYAGINGFVIYDYIAKEAVHKESINWVQSNCIQNNILFTATGSGSVYLYNAETGYQYDTYSFDFPSNTQEIMSNMGVFSGSAGSVIHVRNTFRPPGFTEFDVYDTVFLENNRMLTRSKDNDDSAIDLWEYIKNAGGTVNTVKLSGISLPYVYDFTFNSAEMTLYCVTNTDELYIINIADDEIEIENTIEAYAFDTVHILQDGTPVLLGRREAVINPGKPDSITVEHSMYSAHEVYKRGDSLIVTAGQKIEIIKDTEITEIETADVYAVNPAADEFVFYKDGQLVFRELFTESEKFLDITDYGKIAELFYSPDGSLLFIASEALRVYAYDNITGTLTEMEAEFQFVPKQAFYLDEYLVLQSLNRRTTLWNPETLKIAGQTGILYGYGDGMLILSNGMSSGIVPFYDLPQLMELADEVLSGYEFDGREVARYLS